MNATTTKNLCKCGKRINKYATKCAKCHNEMLEKTHSENRAILATGKCPQCGGAFRRNLSMTGWWQCEQLGAEGFRKDASKPSCSFQCFTE